MMKKVAFESTEMLDTFIGQIQQFGITETQIVFSTAVDRHNIDIGKFYEDDDAW